MKKATFSSMVLTPIVAGLLLYSCKKTETSQKPLNPTSNVNTTDDEVLKKIYKLGIKEKDITSTDNYHIVLGDMLFEKKQKGSRQYYSGPSLIVWSKQPNIKIKIDPSITNPGWSTAVSDAITDWNNIPNCRLKFSIITTGTPDITIKSDNGTLRDGLVVDMNPYPVYYPQAAAASLPEGGNPGSTILINLDVIPVGSSTLSSAQKKYNISHCLGHCVGLVHTDFMKYINSSNGDYFPENIYRIPGTPGTVPNDPSPFSLFNYQDLMRTWSFNADDITAIQYLFSNTIRRVVLQTSNGSYVQAVNGGGGNVVANSANPWAWETFKLTEAPGMGAPYYTLRALNGKYLQAQNGGGYGVNANSDNPYTWETFIMQSSAVTPGTFTFKTYLTNYYLQATNGGGANSTLVANSPNPWSWESFTVADSMF